MKMSSTCARLRGHTFAWKNVVSVVDEIGNRKMHLGTHLTDSDEQEQEQQQLPNTGNKQRNVAVATNRNTSSLSLPSQTFHQLR